MAFLSIALPKFSLFSPKLLCSIPKNYVGTKKVRLPYRKRESHFGIRCLAVTRNDFPTYFKFGASTSALQTEGSGTEGGRGPSTWDIFIEADKGGMGTDSYNKYKEDVQLLKNMGVDVYRFSIAWPRILPKGNVSGGINQDGIDFYNSFINELIDNGIEPFVTLFHFDLPTALQESYNGFLSSKLVDDFKDYAEICFKNFGDRVKNWTTFNEPQVFGQHGYKMDLGVPDDPTTFPYMATHNIILAHAATAALYRKTYQITQGGQIGMSLNCKHFIPYSLSPQDIAAAQRAWDFTVGWYVEPLVTGEYPFIMKAIVRERLPTFTDEEKEMVKGSLDFLGINYYTARYAQGISISPNDVPSSYENDQYLEMLVERDGLLIGPLAEGSEYMYVYPEGLADVLIKVKRTYKNPKIYITENGYPERRDDTIPLEKALEDDVRIEFAKNHFNSIKIALNEEVDVNGYFMWALLDCMEMGSGYTVRLGLNFTDYDDDHKRYAKKSAGWLKAFLRDTNASP